MNDINLGNNISTQEIDTALDNWYSALEHGMSQSIPTITKETIQKPITSRRLKYIQHQFSQLQRTSEMQGWTTQKYYQNRMLKVMLKNEAERIRNDDWERQMTTTAEKYKDPKTFWRNINKLKGNKTQHDQYLQINNTKITNEKGKEEAHRGIWKEVFKITPQENAEYDMDKEEEVDKYLDANEEKITIYQRSDLNRLQGTNNIDTSNARRNKNNN